MFSIISALESLFSEIQSFFESATELNCVCVSSVLPTEDELLGFMSSIPIGGKFQMIICDQAEDTCKISGTSVWLEDYSSYKSDRDDQDIFTIKITLEKEYCEESGIFVYSTAHFVDYLKSRTLSEVLHVFSFLFRRNPDFLRFTILDDNLSLYTEHISFCRENDIMPIESIERTILLKRCEEASTFHDFHTLHLIPQDFHIIASSGDNKTIAEIFQCLETILGYAYVSASSYINDDQLVFYFDPGKANRLDINNCRYSRCITEIFLWAFSNDNALERISIARNVLRLYCRNTDSLLEIDSSVFDSIKSNFNIYQRDTTEKYIELKEKISDYILGLTEQMQELLHGLIDGLRNNFIAIATFAITVLLTDSLPGEELLSDGLPQNLIFVSELFIIITIIYWVATLLTTIVKWRLVKQSYDNIKENYNEILCEKDLTIAFRQDKVIKNARNSIIRYSILISLLWLSFIIAMTTILHSFSSKSLWAVFQEELQFFRKILFP